MLLHNLFEKKQILLLYILHVWQNGKTFEYINNIINSSC